MRQSACIFASIITIAGLLSVGDARAQDTGTPNQPPGTPNQPPPGTPNQPPPGTPGAIPLGQPPPGVVVAQPPGGDGTAQPRRRGEDDEEEDKIKHIALTLNPLGLAITRISVQVDYVFAKHLAVTLNPFFNATTIEVNNVKLATLSGIGAEAGFRFYTGSKGSNGFFIGPSFLFASWSQSRENAAPTNFNTESFTAYGGALDLGGQAIIGPGVIVGGGFGLQYTKTSQDINTDNYNLIAAAIAGGGIRPRFLLSVGFAF